MFDIRVRLGEPFRLAAADRVRPADGPVTLWLTGVRLVTHRPESDEWVYLEGVKVLPDGSLGDHALVLARASPTVRVKYLDANRVRAAGAGGEGTPMLNSNDPGVSTGLPEPVAAATAVARRAGFSMSCEPEVGALLAVLAAAVPIGGRILELGTGVGVGTAWLIHGLGGRTDVELVTVDNDQATADLAAQAAWPSYVRSVVGDAVEVTGGEGAFDLIFADAQGGKWEGLETTVAALRPGGHLLVDDMTAPSSADSHHKQKISEVRTRILGHTDLVSVPMDWSTGLILSTRRRTQPERGAGAADR